MRRAIVATTLAALISQVSQAAPPIVRQSEPRPQREDFAFDAWQGSAHRVFADTLPVHCQRPPRRVVDASFAITLRPTHDAEALRLAFWDRGIEHFNMRVGSRGAPVGTTQTLRFDLAALPPAGGPVLRSTGHGLRLLRDRDFSFSVSDRAAVLQATLTYRCAADAFSFAMAEPVSVIGDYRSSEAWRSVSPLNRSPLVPQQRDAHPGRLSSGAEFE